MWLPKLQNFQRIATVLLISKISAELLISKNSTTFLVSKMNRNGIDGLQNESELLVSKLIETPLLVSLENE